MKKLLGCIRRADQDFSLIAPGDHVVAGVSGGKDSLALLSALALYRRFSPHPFSLSAVTLTLGLAPLDTAAIAEMCRGLEVPYRVVETQIGEIVFNRRREKNPCALCARMRRGALVDACRELGANKLALGHHRDDAIETLFLSMLYEGRIHTFQPRTRLEGSGVTQIRPMIYAPEKHILHVARALALPVQKSPCPAGGGTRRQDMKALVRDICRRVPNAREQILSALQNREQYGLWDDRGEEPVRETRG